MREAAGRRARHSSVGGFASLTAVQARALRVQVQTLTVMKELWQRWTMLRDPILAFGAAHPSQQVEQLVKDFVTDVSNALTSTNWLVHDLPESWSTESLETAKKDHAVARRRADELLAEMRR